jgi:hypothetical protein
VAQESGPSGQPHSFGDRAAPQWATRLVFAGLYFGGELESAGGGVELMAPFGLLDGGVVLSAGGMVVVVPGEVDWSVEEGAGVDVSAGEPAEPAGEVDSCLEQADKSASEPTHNNRTLRFIRSPHYCNGSVKGGPVSAGPTPTDSRKRRSGSQC